MSFKHVIDGIVDAAKQMDEAAKTDLATQFANAAKALKPGDDDSEKGDPADAGAKGEEKATGGGAGGDAGEAADEKPEDEDGEKSKTSKAATMPWPLDIAD